MIKHIANSTLRREHVQILLGNINIFFNNIQHNLEEELFNLMEYLLNFPIAMVTWLHPVYVYCTH